MTKVTLKNRINTVAFKDLAIGTTFMLDGIQEIVLLKINSLPTRDEKLYGTFKYHDCVYLAGNKYLSGHLTTGNPDNRCIVVKLIEVVVQEIPNEVPTPKKPV